MKAKPEVVARLTLVIEYQTMPQDSEIREILDAARGYAEVVTAELETLKLVKVDARNL